MESDLRARHLRELERWRRGMNLVGPGPLEEHFVDCDRALDGLEPTGRWVDAGSGAGFPGLVFAARFKSCSIELVDSRRKRCAFLDHVLGGWEGGSSGRVRVRCERMEDIDGPFDGLLSRAFAPPEEVLALADRVVRPGGLVVLFLQGDAAVPERTGFSVVRRETYEVAGKQRAAAILRRTSSPEPIAPTEP